MATQTTSNKPAATQTSGAGRQVPSKPEPATFLATCWRILKIFLAPVASLKITVVLFLMSIFIVFAGTLAQTEKDIWQVVHDYFRMDLSSLQSALGSALAWIDFRIFFPRSFFPRMDPIPWGIGFWFPSGWLIGLCLFVNLTAAHLIRFKVQGNGKQLTAGIVTVLAGIVLTVIVIATGSHQTATQLKVFTEWPSLRILWLLTQCTVVSLVLLAGFVLVFRKRAGIVLLHSGVGLLMFGELLVGISAVEGQMQIIEGQTSNVVMDTRELELAIIDRTNETEDSVVAIPQSRLQPGVVIKDDALPMEVELVRFMRNSRSRGVMPKDKNPATAGAGLVEMVDEVEPVAGTDNSGRSNQSAAYVRFVDSRSGDTIGVYLLTLQRWFRGGAEKIEAGGQVYDVSLRYKQDYKPYSMHLVDVEQEVYIGTKTPRSYASELRLVDPARNVDRRVRIWMNNPLRFGGETFYQSNYGRDPATGQEYTGLQVVTNTGWRIPYVSCMMVAVGMLAQFWVTLNRYLTRRAEGRLGPQAADAAIFGASSVPTTAPRNRRERSKGPAPPLEKKRNAVNWAVPLVVVLLCAAWLAGKAREPAVGPNEIDYAAFGRLPVTYEGRVKPFDTLARNSLRIVSDKQSYVDGEGRKQPAIRWLLDVITDSPAARKHQVFRIHNLDLLETLGLKPRKGFRYSINDFESRLEALDKQVRKAQSTKPEQRDLYSKKVLELDRKLDVYILLREAFRMPQMRLESFREDRLREANRREQYSDYPLPLAVPSPRDGDGHWQPYTFALFDALALKLAASEGVQATEANPATIALAGILTTYSDTGDQAAAFNRQVASYRRLLEEDRPVDWNETKTDFEVFFNHAAPLYHAMALYLFAFLLGCFAWLGWTVPLKRASIWLCVFTLGVHTLALIGRMYISGRPPITTLYTSALFVGWACVLLGLLMEWYSKIGVANVVAAFAGFGALLIGYKLTTAVISFKGDTFTVLMAVLDTNFWLATHVTCVATGYSATFFAGLLGIVYVLRGAVSPSLTPPVAKDIGRMIYGTVCFAIFFSFFGTVLGGLWADDSWGRFWGWDPKENGALIIVLWNAVVLHAYWGRIVGERGLAVLAIVGNIVTAWSWFGVNELGVGLHSYGFTEGVLMILAANVAVQLLIIGIGVFPKRWWWSNRVQAQSS